MTGRKQKAFVVVVTAMLAVGIAVWIQVATGSPAVTAVGFALAGLLGSYFGWRWSRKKSAEVEGYRQELIGKRPIEDLRSDRREDLDE
jgi:membrane protein implicated in regulation of membrane protease activity